MLRMTCLISVFIISFLSSVANASNSYVIDFSTYNKYVESLNNIRVSLGRPLWNISQAGTHVYQLTTHAHAGSRNGIIIVLRGIDYYNQGGVIPVSFVLDPANLYLCGFISNNIYYRFADALHINIPGVSDTVQLYQNSSYTTLQRFANLAREGMAINRANLTDGYVSLALFYSRNLNQRTARALLRYTTVISEALRFRQIQRGVRLFLGIAPASYIISSSDITLTLNWAGLSSVLPDVDAMLTPGIRVGNIYLVDTTAILSAIALTLGCNINQQIIVEHEIISVNACFLKRSVAINKTVWSRRTLVLVLPSLGV